MSDAAPAAGGQGAAAAAVASAAAPAVPAAPAAVVPTTDWTAGMPDEARGYIQNKAWKSPADLLTSYQNLEKLRGVPQERLLALPEKADAPEWAGIWQKLGVPEKADGYQLGEKISPEFAKKAGEWMKELNIPAQAGKTFFDKFTADIEAAKQAAEEKFAQDSDLELKALQKEWGQAAPAMEEHSRRGAALLGLQGEVIDKIERAIGTKAVLSMLAKIGEMTAEHKFVAGDNKTGFILTPEAAKARIADLKKDSAWAGRYLNGGADEKAEMDRLSRIAYG